MLFFVASCYILYPMITCTLLCRMKEAQTLLINIHVEIWNFVMKTNDADALRRLSVREHDFTEHIYTDSPMF